MKFFWAETCVHFPLCAIKLVYSCGPLNWVLLLICMFNALFCRKRRSFAFKMDDGSGQGSRIFHCSISNEIYICNVLSILPVIVQCICVKFFLFGSCISFTKWGEHLLIMWKIIVSFKFVVCLFLTFWSIIWSDDKKWRKSGSYSWLFNLFETEV